MIAKEWRGRLAYLGLSVIVAWHTVAMVVAPAPESHVADAVRDVFHPYLTLLRLDNEWDFFAPDVGEGSRLTYIIEDSTGANHSFTPADELSWFDPNYFWMRSRYYAIIDEPAFHAESAAALFCRKHAALNPVAISFYEMQEEKFTLDDHLRGKRRTDPEFFTVKTVQRLPCPGK